MQIKALNKALSKMRTEDAKKMGELVEKTSYEFSPSFVYHNGMYSCTVQLYVRQGSNRSLTFDNILSIIPTNPRSGIKIHLIEVDGCIFDEEKKSLIREGASKNAKVIKEEHKQNESGEKRRKKTQSEIKTDIADMEDYADYEQLLDSNDPVVYYKIVMRIVGQDKQQIDEQIEDLNTLFKQDFDGLKIDSTAGDQRARFLTTFAPLKKGEGASTSTGANYAGINFAASPSLCDDQGVVIGADVLSLVGSSAVFDFDGSTGVQPAVISVARSEQMPLYDSEQLSAASVTAQAAANDIVLHGHRAAHLVLNKFDYTDETMGFVRPVYDGAFKVYDVQKMTINPLQGFGDEKDVVAIYPRLTSKLTNIFDMLNDYSFEVDTQNGLALRGIITEAIQNFYVTNGYWTADAQINPARTKIVNIQNPAAYATMGSLIQSFTSIEEGSRRKGSINIADKAYSLHNILEGALIESMDILGRPTSITPSDALQTYYSFGNIASDKMKNVQFVNILDYVIWTLNKGDVLVIHGANELDRIVLSDFVSKTLSAAMDAGIRVIFAFDCVSSPDQKEFKGANKSDIFSMRGAYYTDLSKDLSWSMVGAMMEDELQKYSTAMNKVQLSERIVANANTRGACQVLLNRSCGGVNNFVQLACLI